MKYMPTAFYTIQWATLRVFNLIENLSKCITYPEDTYSCNCYPALGPRTVISV